MMQPHVTGDAEILVVTGDQPVVEARCVGADHACEQGSTARKEKDDAKSMNRRPQINPTTAPIPDNGSGLLNRICQSSRHQAGGLQILQQNDRLTVADLPVSDHLQRG